MGNSAEKLNIAVLGDLHGHFTLGLTLLKRWETETGEAFDYVLQVGDFGVWPDPLCQIDPATYRFAQRDPEEISFPEFMIDSPSARHFLSQDSPDETRLKAPIIFVKGNHEDFTFLQQAESYPSTSFVPVDYFRRFLYLPNGRVVSLKARDIELRVGGIGGTERGKDQARFTKRELNLLVAQEDIDIILAHEPYQGALREGVGSPKLRGLVNLVQPEYFFCGHYHTEGQELNSPDNHTQAYILNEVNFRRRRHLNLGCIGILRWKSKEDHEFELLDAEWLQEYSRDNYKPKGLERRLVA